MHVRQGGRLYRIDDHSTDHYLVLLFRYEVPGSGGILPGDDHGDERHSHFNTSPFVDLYHQAKVHQREEEGLERKRGKGCYDLVICILLPSPPFGKGRVGGIL